MTTIEGDKIREEGGYADSMLNNTKIEPNFTSIGCKSISEDYETFINTLNHADKHVSNQEIKSEISFDNSEHPNQSCLGKENIPINLPK